MASVCSPVKVKGAGQEATLSDGSEAACTWGLAYMWFCRARDERKTYVQIDTINQTPRKPRNHPHPSRLNGK